MKQRPYIPTKTECEDLQWQLYKQDMENIENCYDLSVRENLKVKVIRDWFSKVIDKCNNNII